MERKYYQNSKEAAKEIYKYLLVSVGGILILLLINYISFTFFERYFVPHILVLPAFFLVILVYRSILLFKLPMIKISERGISYFNVIWYSFNHWNTFDLAHYDPDNKVLELRLSNGRIKEKLHLGALTYTEIEDILSYLRMQKKQLA